MTCHCGYDYARLTGHQMDVARCLVCTWVAYGIFADHQAQHHWLATTHPYTIEMGDKR